MRIGIDFDNTIICYERVFRHLALQQNLITADFTGNKTAIRDAIRASHGDIKWQHLQGKAYGVEINHAEIFAGFKDFIAACNAKPNIELFIVSHKTEFGHFDETKTSLRTAAREWLRQQTLFDGQAPYIKEEHLFFEMTLDEKIARIAALNCTHFIDDLVEVLYSPLFPANTKKFLFQPTGHHTEPHQDSYSTWKDIHYAILGSA